jgi:hypothetical protein
MDEELKHKFKEIYDFVEVNQIQSFYCCGYDYHPRTTLEDMIDPKFSQQPNIIIHLNTSCPNYLEEKKLIQERFPRYYFIHSYYKIPK